MINQDIVSNIQKTVKEIESSLTRAYNDCTPTFLILYFVQFVEWCKDKGLVEFDGSLEVNSSDPLKPFIVNKLNWLRDAKTNKLPKGTELAWFRFLFPEIPEEREEYRTHSLYRTLTQTIHKRAEQLSGIEYHRAVGGEVKGKDKSKGPIGLPSHDDNGVALPTGLNETEFVLAHPITQAVMLALASFEAKAKKQSGLLDSFAQSLQLPQGIRDAMRIKQDEYIKRIKADIAAAKKEQATANPAA